jgi:hypothetical protein
MEEAPTLGTRCDAASGNFQPAPAAYAAAAAALRFFLSQYHAIQMQIS